MLLEACLESPLPHFTSTLARLRARGDIEQDTVDAICGALIRDVEVARDDAGNCPEDSSNNENTTHDYEAMTSRF